VTTMPETPNHGYNVPDEGAQNWHEPLNENFEQYDTDIEIRDESGNIGDYEPKEGAKFFATDIGVAVIGDGSEWQGFSSMGPRPTFETVDIDGDGLGGSLRLISEPDGRSTMRHSVYTLDSNGEHNGTTFRLEQTFDDETDEWLIRHRGEERTFHAVKSRGDGHVGVSMPIDSSPDVPLHVGGDNNWNLDEGDGDFKIGDDDYRLAMGVALGGGGAGACNIRAKGGIQQLQLGAGESGHTLRIRPDTVSVNGDFDVSGNKNFVQSVDTDDGEREVVYTATEAGTPHTEASGVAELADGRAEVDLPEHFAWVTSEADPLMVQTTPYGGSTGLKVVERSTDRIVVEALDGEGDYEFAYTVKGTRDGQENKRIVREPSAADAASDSTERPTADD
jgi:hypothetical protein